MNPKARVNGKFCLLSETDTHYALYGIHLEEDLTFFSHCIASRFGICIDAVLIFFKYI